MSNRMKALYAIILPKTGDKTDAARIAQDVNQERLNDNFRTITNELMKIWEGGEQSLNLLAARVTSVQEVTDAEIRDIIANVATNTAAIAMVPGQITSQVSESLEGYALETYVDEKGETVYGDALTAANSYTDSKVTQTANELNVAITQNDLSSWVRIVGANAQAGTLPGVIIGNTESDTSLKAEATALFFYRGNETQAKQSNADVLLDASGNLIAKNIHNDSLLLNGKFDIDVVTAGGVDYLHITGRS